MKLLALLFSLLFSVFIGGQALASHSYHNNHGCDNRCFMSSLHVHACSHTHPGHRCHAHYHQPRCAPPCHHDHTTYAGFACSVDYYGQGYEGKINRRGLCVIRCQDQWLKFRTYTILVR